MGIFQVGDGVIDREGDDARMIVLHPDRGTADDVYIEDLDATVADVNETYPRNDTVVECVHEEWLDRHTDSWTTWNRDTFADALDAFLDKWNIPLQSYRYPSERLRHVGDEVDPPDGQSRLDAW